MELLQVYFLLSCALLVVAIDPNDCDVNVSGTCFIIQHQELRWNDARSKCQDLGGDLAVLDKINVQEAVNALAVGGKSLWIGLHDLAIDGQPFWVDPGMYYNSSKVYPWAASDNNTPDRDCVLASENQNGAFEWQYNNCESPREFLCEIIGSDDQADMERINEDKLRIEVARLTEHEKPSSKIAKINQYLDLHEGDIKLNEEEILRRDMGLPIYEKRGAAAEAQYLWPDRTVHYVFDDNMPLTEAKKQVVRNALFALEEMTCLTFIEGFATDYLNIINSNGCWSYIGRQGGAQPVSLQDNSQGSCISEGVIQHEIMHALSFLHEQARYDRDDYVTINWANILPNFQNNFDKVSPSTMTLQNTNYDFGSLLHYSLYAFALDPSVKVIIPHVDPGIEVGHKNGPSVLDLIEINGLYKCEVINGNWSPWSAWTDCSVTCGGSTQTRNRDCNSPAPSVASPGAPCAGADTETRSCMTIDCPLEIDYEHRSCWLDQNMPPLLTSLENTNNPYLDGHYASRTDKTRKCARAAVHAGFQYFAHRLDSGKCFGTSDEGLYRSQGASTECVTGFGTTNSIDVYEIIGQCRDNCGAYISERECYCDALCVEYGDCCPEYTDDCSDSDFCFSFGGPHYWTFDNKFYNYQGGCDYVLINTECPNSLYHISVIVNNKILYPSYALSWTTDVTLNIYDMVIHLLPSKAVKIDGNTVLPPVQLSTYLNIELAGFWVATTNNEFGDSWQVTGSDCTTAHRSVYDEVPRDTATAEQICNHLFTAGNIPACKGLVDPAVFLGACIMDLSATLPGDPSGGCAVVSAYVMQCQDVGIVVGDWRTGNECEIPCPVGSAYSSCGPTCPATCANPNPVGSCTQQCIEGCFCEPGKVVTEGGQCIDQLRCGCYYLGLLYKFGEEQANGKTCDCKIPGTVCVGCRHFEVITDEVTWEAAKSNCESDGGRLAKIDTQEIFDNIRQYIFANNLADKVRNGFWFGLDDIDNEGTYMWSDGTRLLQGNFVRWAKRQPNNSTKKDPNGQDCGLMKANNHIDVTYELTSFNFDTLIMIGHLELSHRINGNWNKIYVTQSEQPFDLFVA
uniref:Metalloendopeptidase n=1 Tax=Saccoglossus kowalevskii TaxID=10224 RepID=A0ABM0GK76_SACKO|nr:PREDICTED: uncharacterized protein LOC100368870 [Saccoglossus kowalevskii]